MDLSRRVFGLMAVAWFLWMFGWATSTQAYVLQGEHVLELMVAELGTEETLRVQQNVTDLQSANPAPVDEILTYAFPDRFRADADDGSVRTTFIREAGRIAFFRNGLPTPKAVDRQYFYADVLLYRQRQLLADRLVLAGVDVSVTSLGRHDERVCYVVGAVYPDDAPAQLWVDKSTLRPYRVMIPTERQKVQDQGSLEFRYLEWTQAGASWYPQHIEVLRNGVPIQDIRVASVVATPPADPVFFSIAARMAEAGALRSPERPLPDVEASPGIPGSPGGYGEEGAETPDPMPGEPAGSPTTP